MNKEIRSLLGIELRAADDGKATMLRGYAALFEKRSLDLGGFTEVIKKGAFARSLNAGSDVLALAHHDSSKVLARRSKGTLTIEEDDTGLLVSITVPNTTVGKDTAEDVRVGNLQGMSFGFVTRKDSWTKPEKSGDLYLRELQDVDIHEVSAVAWPAYPDTSIALRGKPGTESEPFKPDAELLRRLQQFRFRLISLEV